MILQYIININVFVHLYFYFYLGKLSKNIYSESLQFVGILYIAYKLHNYIQKIIGIHLYLCCNNCLAIYIILYYATLEYKYLCTVLYMYIIINIYIIFCYFI